jgi:hypothetical protein
MLFLCLPQVISPPSQWGNFSIGWMGHTCVTNASCSCLDDPDLRWVFRRAPDFRIENEQQIRSGAIIGCTVDHHNQSVTFSLNGKVFSEVFKRFRREKVKWITPVVSIHGGDVRLVINLGGKPFHFMPSTRSSSSVWSSVIESRNHQLIHSDSLLDIRRNIKANGIEDVSDFTFYYFFFQFYFKPISSVLPPLHYFTLFDFSFGLPCRCFDITFGLPQRIIRS